MTGMRVLQRLSAERMKSPHWCDLVDDACDWARANGLTPEDVTGDRDVEVVLTDAGPAIRCFEFVRDEDGRARLDPARPGELLLRERVVLCRVPMPGHVSDPLGD